MAAVGWGSAGGARWDLGILGWWVTSVEEGRERGGKGGEERRWGQGWWLTVLHLMRRGDPGEKAERKNCVICCSLTSSTIRRISISHFSFSVTYMRLSVISSRMGDLCGHYDALILQ